MESKKGVRRSCVPDRLDSGSKMYDVFRGSNVRLSFLSSPNSVNLAKAKVSDGRRQTAFPSKQDNPSNGNDTRFSSRIRKIHSCLEHGFGVMYGESFGSTRTLSVSSSHNDLANTWSLVLRTDRFGVL